MNKTFDTRFQKYSAPSNSEENEPLTHDMMEMFGDDAQANSSNQNEGLRLDKAQIDVLNSSWWCQAPEKLTAYRDSYKQAFPIHESSEKMLQVPSLDEFSERLLIKKHGRRAAFGNSQSLFTQLFKSMEKSISRSNGGSYGDCFFVLCTTSTWIATYKFKECISQFR